MVSDLPSRTSLLPKGCLVLNWCWIGGCGALRYHMHECGAARVVLVRSCEGLRMVETVLTHY